MKPAFTCCILLALNFSVYAGNNDSLAIRKIANEILGSNRAYANLEYLCKKIGPRLSGSVNASRAIVWGLNALKDAGADTVYLQPCMVKHWERGGKEAGFVRTQAGTRQLKLSALGNSVGTGPVGILAPVIEVKSFAELDSLGEKNIKGKIVFYNYPMNPLFINTFEAYGDAVRYRSSGPSNAAKYGAVGVMVRSQASNTDQHPHTGVTFYNAAFPKIPAVSISTAEANWLSELLQHKDVLEVGFTTHCKMENDTLSYNVIGEIKGNKFPDEIITVGGHLDSWDLAEGAQDDGAGCVQSIEVIRAFIATGLRPDRTVRAVLFMNEENGAGGAQAYFDSAIAKKENHIFALESDAGGFTPRGFSVTASDSQFRQLQKWLPLFIPYGLYYFKKGESGVDIGFLEKTGAALVGLEPDSQRYFDLHHAENDVFEAVSKRELELGAINMAALVWLVSKYGLN